MREWVKEEHVWGWVHFKPQHHYTCDGTGKIIMVDFVGRVESLGRDFAFVSDRMKYGRELEKANIGCPRHYSTYYDEETRDIVRRVYAKDSELFAYSFQSYASGSAGGEHQ